MLSFRFWVAHFAWSGVKNWIPRIPSTHASYSLNRSRHHRFFFFIFRPSCFTYEAVIQFKVEVDYGQTSNRFSLLYLTWDTKAKATNNYSNGQKVNCVHFIIFLEFKFNVACNTHLHKHKRTFYRALRLNIDVRRWTPADAYYIRMILCALISFRMEENIFF